MEQTVFHWISQYGCPAIFVLLVFGIVGLPVPDETLLTFSGYLIFKGDLPIAATFAAAFGGSVCGITVSYTLGRTFGIALIHRYGRYLRITERHVNLAHAWFERVGRWGLTFGYFIPGVRHFTAYAAGMSELEPHVFGAFAYSGALLWVSTFLTLGYFLGERWEAVSSRLHHDAVLVTLVAAAAAGIFLLWRKWRRDRTK